jgi:diadenosine tetraphosphate (Ap4A) HIT family hydrolase
MPYLISREQALAQIEKEIPAGECLICYLAKHRKEYILHRGKHAKTLLSLYPRTWGQIMVLVNRHVISFTELEADEWKEVSEMLLQATRKAESVLKPLRCYVAATGASVHFPMTSPHLHFNIIPVYEETDKPSSIFTWENGLYAARTEEWEALAEALVF